MNLFRVEVEEGWNNTSSGRTWLVAADSLFDALSLIPDSSTVKSVEVQVAVAQGPGRVIGWMGPRVVH